MKSFEPPITLYVNDTVVISSVGFTAETNAASLRAGISRPEKLYGFGEETDDDEENITGYPITLLTHGFEGAGRYIQLMLSGFEQVANKLVEIKKTDHKVGCTEIYLLMGVPDVTRYLQTEDLDKPLNENPFQFYNKGWNETVEIALSQSGLISLISGYKVMPIVLSSCTELIKQSSALIQKKPNAMVITGFVDSLTDFAGLTWLDNMGRLKSANNPVGLMPGEAISFLFINSVADIRAVEIVSINQEQEEHSFYSSEQPEGKAINQLLVNYSNEYPSSKEGEFWCINNFTGEERLAMEWGNALHHYQKSKKINPLPDLWIPNISLGDIGICFFPIAISWAHQAFRRHYAPTSTCAIAAFCYSNVRNLITIRGAAHDKRAY